MVYMCVYIFIYSIDLCAYCVYIHVNGIRSNGGDEWDVFIVTVDLSEVNLLTSLQVLNNQLTYI